jgi:5'-deoxynucleotidase YfbR-like HD superfamily hydrolase
MGFIRTFNGAKFDLANPLAENMRLDDVALSLSNSCRWVGHVRTHMATAHHSVLVSQRAEARARALIANEKWAAAKMRFGELVHMAAKAGFCHDFTEAWYGDVSTPLKQMHQMAGYRALEALAMEQVGIKWEVDFFHPVIHALWEAADREVLATEARDLREGDHPERLALIVRALPTTIIPLSAEHAHELFMRRAAELGLS